MIGYFLCFEFINFLFFLFYGLLFLLSFGFTGFKLKWLGDCEIDIFCTFYLFVSVIVVESNCLLREICLFPYFLFHWFLLFLIFFIFWLFFCSFWLKFLLFIQLFFWITRSQFAFPRTIYISPLFSIWIIIIPKLRLLHILLLNINPFTFFFPLLPIFIAFFFIYILHFS